MMMNYSYRVYHSEVGKSRVEQTMCPLSLEAQLGEYQLLPAYLAHRFRDSGIAAEYLCPQNALPGVLVSLETELSQEEVDAFLAKCLVPLNHEIAGLCLVADRVK